MALLRIQLSVHKPHFYQHLRYQNYLVHQKIHYQEADILESHVKLVSPIVRENMNRTTMRYHIMLGRVIIFHNRKKINKCW